MGKMNMNGKVRLDIDSETYNEIQRHYFDRISGRNFITCGAEILDSYEGTATVQRCKEIAGDGRLTAADLFIHHIFKEKIVPRSFRKHIAPVPLLNGRPGSVYRENADAIYGGAEVFVGLPLLKWMLGKFGVVANKRPETICEEASGEPTTPDCSIYSSAFYYARDVEAKNEDYRRFSSSNRISASSILSVFQKYIRDGMTGEEL